MAVKKEVLIETIEKAKKALASLPDKEPEKKVLELALEELKPAIESLLDRGYSRAEVVDLLIKQGVPAKLYHIKNLLRNTKK